jgi:pyruvate/2-oxoglutarate dehydrogenase complex dihydrolipoamide dehydrogenase (E3) component
MSQYDVIVIGGGPGEQLMLSVEPSKKVASLKKLKLGEFVNRGCIPSKTYLYLTELLGNINKTKRHGIEVGEPKVIWEDAKSAKI